MEVAYIDRECAMASVGKAGPGESSLSRVLRQDDALMTQLKERLGLRGLSCLRGSCREARAAADRTLGSLSFVDACEGPFFHVACVREYKLPSGVAAGVRGMVSRGCRLQALTFKLRWSAEAGYDPDASIAFGLSILAELAVEPSLTELTLQGLPLTAEVVRAIAAAAPRPRKLVLYSYDSCPQDSSGSSVGVRDLLHHAAPHLQQLQLYRSTSLLEAPLVASSASPAGAPSSDLASLLQQCSRLQSLELGAWGKAADDPGVLHALALLPALRNLTLVEPYYGGPTFYHLSALSSLSRLTRLRTSAHVGLLLPGLASMHSLVELDLTYSVQLDTQLGQLTALTALTSLRVTRLLAPADPAPPAGGGGAAGGPAPGLPLGRDKLVQLPPHLRYMSLAAFDGELIGADVLAALQLPPSLTLIELEGLELPAGATDEEDVLRPAAAEAVLVACRQLAGRLFPRPRDSDQPFQLDLGRAKAPATWQGLYAPLFAALRPLALRGLHLSCGPLTVRDVVSLVRQLPTLEVLELGGGAMEVAALPLLHRLRHLRWLTVYLQDVQGLGDLAEGWSSKAALGAALLALCMHAPNLECITLNYTIVQHWPLRATAAAVRRWLLETLPHVCRKFPEIDLHNDTSSDFDDDDGNIGVGSGEGDGSDGGDGDG